MNIKKELIWGWGLTVVVVILTGYYLMAGQKLSSTSIIKSNGSKQGTSTQPTSSVILTTEEVQKHNQPTDCWLIIENKVYNVTDYLNIHPGGAGRITPYCGSDATQAFLTKDGQGSHSQTAFQDLTQLYIGDLNGQIKQMVNPTIINNLPRRGRGGREENDD